MADFTVEGIVSVDVSKGIRDLRRFSKTLEGVWGELEHLDDKIDDIDGRRMRVKVDADTKLIAQVKEDLKSINDEGVEIRLNTDGSITQIKEDLDTISDEEINVNLDADGIAAEIAAISEQMDELDDVHIDVWLDTERTIMKAERLNAEIDAAIDENKTVKVDVEYNEADWQKLKGQIQGVTNSIGGPSARGGMMAGLIGAAMLATPTLVGLGAIGVGALAGLAGGLGAVVAGSGALAAFAVPAFTEVKEGLAEISEAAEGLEGAAKFDAMRDAVGDLDSELRPVVRSIINFQEEYENLAETVKPHVFDMFAAGVNVATSVLDDIAPIAINAADALTVLFGDMERNLNEKGGDWQRFFTYIEDNIGFFMKTWGRAVGDIVTGVANMIVALDPLSRWFSKGFRNMAADFREWSSTLGESEGFKNFVNFVKEEGPKAWEALKAIGRVFGELIVALAPLAGPISESITDFANKLADLIEKNPGMARAGFVAVALGLALGGPLAAGLGAVAGPFGKFITWVLGASGAGKILAGIGTGAGGAAVGIGALVVAAGAVLGILALTIDTGKEYEDMWNSIKEAWNKVKDAAKATWENLQDLWEIFKDSGAIENVQLAIADLAESFGILAPAIEPVVTIIGGVLLGLLWALSWAIRGLAIAVEDFIAPFKPAIEAGVALFQWMFDKLVGHSIIPDLINGIKDWFGKLPGFIMGAITGLPGKVAGLFGDLAGRAFNKLNELKNDVGDKLGEIKNNITTRLTEAKNNAVSRFQEMRTGVGNKVSEIKNNIQTGFSAAKTILTTKMTEMKNSAVQKAGDLISGMRERLSNAKTTVTNAFSGAGSWLLSAGSQLMAGLAQGIRDGADAAIGAAEWVAGQVGRLVPGSPVKDGPLQVFNNGEVGQKLMGMLATGIASDSSVNDAMTRQFKQVDIPKLAISETVGRSFDNMNRAGGVSPVTTAMGGGNNYYNITLQATPGTDKAALGRELVDAIEAYEDAGGKRGKKP